MTYSEQTEMNDLTIDNPSKNISIYNSKTFHELVDYIYQLKGTNDIVYDVKEFYKTEFEEARLEYNNKQSRPSRRIDDYFEYVSSW